MNTLKKLPLATFVLLVLVSPACGGNKITPKDTSQLATFAAEIGLCNAQPDPVACKQAAKVAFDAQERAQFDGGYAAPDGGAL